MNFHVLYEIECPRQQGVDFMILLVQAGSLRHDDICNSLRRFGEGL